MVMALQALLIIATGAIGFIFLAKTLVRFCNWVWVTFLRPPKNLKHCYGSWALITGSTDGIGKALAFELASKGLNLVLLGRDPLKLERTMNEIREKSGSSVVEVKYIVADFAKDECDEFVKKIEVGIRGLDIGVLVNNAGFGYPYAKYFHELGSEVMESIVKVNINGATWVTKAVLPVMMKKKKGAIVNIGSGSGLESIIPSYPFYTVYAATKAYLAMFSRSISLEYKKHGIDVQCQIPLFVSTKMASIRRSSFFIPSPEIYSKASVRWIGYEHICVPYWTHSTLCFMIRGFPDALINYFLSKYFLTIRKRGLAKDSMKNKKKS